MKEFLFNSHWTNSIWHAVSRLHHVVSGKEIPRAYSLMKDTKTYLKQYDIWEHIQGPSEEALDDLIETYQKKSNAKLPKS